MSSKIQKGAGAGNSEKKKTAAANYEKAQSFNPIVKFLHGVRYGHLLREFDAISARSGDRPIRVVEIGCAFAKTFSILKDRYKVDYLGIELNSLAAETAHDRYSRYDNFRIINDPVENHYAEFETADVILAMETLEHIPEHIVVRVVEAIGKARPETFICSVPNEVGPIVWVKNVGSLLMGYMRHKEYRWSETWHAGIYNLDKVDAHGTGHKGFDWRWLAQTIRHNIRITESHSSPVSWFPKTLSVSVIFICRRGAA
jgi:uncharacterized protein YfbU (UPF0304 family)